MQALGAWTSSKVIWLKLHTNGEATFWKQLSDKVSKTTESIYVFITDSEGPCRSHLTKTIHLN